MEWISVYTQMPNDGDRVIYYAPEVGVHSGRYRSKENCWGGPSGFLCGDEVRYWMPLPDPPEENK